MLQAHLRIVDRFQEFLQALDEGVPELQAQIRALPPLPQAGLLAQQDLAHDAALRVADDLALIQESLELAQRTIVRLERDGLILNQALTCLSVPLHALASFPVDAEPVVDGTELSPRTHALST